MKRGRGVYYARKLGGFLLSVFVLSLGVFFLSRLAPVDPLRAYYGERVEKMSPEEKDRARKALGLDQPLPVQYLRWAERALRGDFGISYQYKQDVLEVIGQRAGNTLALGGLGFLLTALGALGLGTLCAWFQGKWPDRLLCRLGSFASCIPEFWLSLVLILAFSVTLRWLPSGGAYSVGGGGGLGDRALHLVLPMAVVLSGHLWYYAYLLRSRLLEEVRADYVLLARAKGLNRGRVLVCHCLRCALPSYISLLAVSAPHILGGTYIVEAVFSYPGVGALCYESARYGDYNLLMVLCLLTGSLVMFSGMLGRILSERLDARVRGAEKEGAGL